MKTVMEYLRHAEECDALVRSSKSDEEREMIRQMATTWRMLADHRRKRLLQEADAERLAKSDE